MAWPFLTDILRRKLWCSGPSASVPQRPASPTGHRSEPGSTRINTFPSSFSPLSLTHFSTELSPSDQNVRAVCLFFQLDISLSRLPAFLLTFLLPPLSVFYNLSRFFHHFHQLPFLSIHHIAYFPHLLVIVLNVHHLPNNCRYPPDT